MPINKPTSPIKASTQSFVEIEDIKDDIIVLRDSFAATVLEVGAVNFWLLSQEEQNSMIVAYGNLLNSLSFPVQILILSKKMDISLYLDYLANKVSRYKDMSIFFERMRICTGKDNEFKRFPYATIMEFCSSWESSQKLTAPTSSTVAANESRKTIMSSLISSISTKLCVDAFIGDVGLLIGILQQLF